VSFLLDTNICSFHLRNRDSLTTRFIQHSGRIAVPTIVVGELHAWAQCAPNPAKRLATVVNFLNDLILLPYDAKCAERFGITKDSLKRMGIAVPTADLMIAAVALVHDLTLVTHNTKDFRHIPDLRLVDWIAEL
jgi:tRNA(fMet)-specific endonuclease VapC